MNQIILGAPYLALICGAMMVAKALRLFETKPGAVSQCGRQLALWWSLMFVIPAVSYGQSTDLRTSAEAGNAIIMYLCGIIAAIGIVSAGVSMMMGRPQVAKWSFGGALVAGLGFAIVRTMWDSFGLTAADVGTF